MTNFKQFLLERKYEEMPDGTEIYLNPTIDELNGLHINAIRGFIDNGGNVFIWGAYGGQHEQVAKYLNEKIFIAFALAKTNTNRIRGLELNPNASWKIMLARYSTPSGMIAKGEQIIVNNKNIQRMMMGKPELISV